MEEWRNDLIRTPDAIAFRSVRVREMWFRAVREPLQVQTPLGVARLQPRHPSGQRPQGRTRMWNEYENKN